MHCRRAGQGRADRGRAHLICDGLQQRDRQCSRTCEGKRKTDEVFILAWARTKTRQLEPSNKRNEGLGQQRLLEFGRDAGGQSGHLWGTSIAFQAFYIVLQLAPVPLLYSDGIA